MLHVDKVDSLLAEKIRITASGLEKFQCYKLYLKLHYRYGAFHSFCVIRSDEFGTIDLCRDKPIRGTYHEIDQMGLFLAVQPSREVRFGHALRNNLANSFYYTLSLLLRSGEILDQVVLRKRWSHPLVSQFDVSQNGLYGTIYKPPGPGPFPCLIDIPGVNGNLNNGHASVFSTEGFVVYSFAFFDYKDLPKNIQDVDMEVFSNHIEYIKSLSFCSGKIGLYGSSLGGTIALYLSTKHPELSAVVSLNGPEAFYKETAAMRENGKPMELETFDDGFSKVINRVVYQKDSFNNVFNQLKPETSIKWENISKEIPFRIVSSVDDWLLCGVTNGSNIRKHLLKTGHQVEIEFVPGGHLIFVPYYPHQALAYNKFVRLSLGFGGECISHAKSQETVWKNHLKFFKKHLGTPNKLPDFIRDIKVMAPVFEKSKI